MSSVVFYCGKCDGANDFGRRYLYELADACKYCGSKGQWRTQNEPKKPYDLSDNDRRMLRSARIDPE